MFRMALGFIFAVLIGAFTSAQAQENTSVIDRVKDRGELVVGIRQDNPPHSFINEQGDWVGFDVDIANAVAEKLGVKMKRVPVDEITRITYLQNGKIDMAAASMSHTWKRDDAVDFSQTYFWSAQTFLVRKDGAKNLKDLVGKKVGMNRGSHSIGNWKKWLEKNGYEVNEEDIIEFGNKQIAMNAVLSGKIAGWAEDAEVLANYAKPNPELIVLSGEAIGMKQDGLGVIENDSKMRDAINHALQQIESSGEYLPIYNRWFGPDSDTPVPLDNRIEVWPGG
ncbi:transporter substrate-binding domain-containing protein [Enterovibrio makurazakiensis]|uniref:Transporter substrate-binding domain-containing protein n=1 Tax=Enterovibrio gelatinilyticus TaxID=2899819 RepID=A0ABT5R1S5_9GAMM|nr:transporter substrate-binding domain-containing protein [Enterovibrio sp. ZSDZ42]MDD1794228.1 transporter substrate-binding domain-containing protein [Enterovibrio sp. ZSDZ42]